MIHKLLFVICFFLVLRAQGQGTDSANNIESFEYKCDRIADRKDELTIKLTVEKFEQKDSIVDLRILVVANCGSTYKGRVLVMGDTLKIFDNSWRLIKRETDSLGQVRTTWEETTVYCTCVSHYAYKLRGIRSKINVVQFYKQSVRVK